MRPAFPVLMVLLVLIALHWPAAGGVDLRLYGPSDGSLSSDTAVAIFENGVPDDLGPVLASSDTLTATSERLSFAAVETTDDIKDLIARLESHDEVEKVYRARVISIDQVQDDPLIDDQWGLDAIGIQEAWDRTMGSHNVTVAVLDTGIDYGHEDLRPNTSAADAGCGPDANVWNPSAGAGDDHGHGTHVAGTIAAVTSNQVGVAGVAQTCIMSVKVLNEDGDGLFHNVALGILHAVDNGADVISMSLGAMVFDPTMLLAAEYAHDHGVLQVASAGNTGCNGGVSYPAAFSEVIAVAALASATERATFSGCGPEVEISAPGQDILSTERGHDYGTRSGTSMAAPHVSAVAALVFDVRPGLTHHEVRCLLSDSADPLGDPEQFGHGRVDPTEAVDRAVAWGQEDPCWQAGSS